MKLYIAQKKSRNKMGGYKLFTDVFQLYYSIEQDKKARKVSTGKIAFSK